MNKVIYEKQIYYKISDIADKLKLSLYMTKKQIDTLGIQVSKLKGFGTGLFIEERQACKLISKYGDSLLLGTKIRTKEEVIKDTYFISSLVSHCNEDCVNEKIEQELEKYDAQEDYIEIKEELTTYEIEEDKEIQEMNKKFEEADIALKGLTIKLMNPTINDDDNVLIHKVNFIIDKDSNVVSDIPYYKHFEIQKDKLYINWNEQETGILDIDYDQVINIEYGKVQNIDIEKILKQLVQIAYSNDFKDTLFDDCMEVSINNTKLIISDKFLQMLRHKDTKIIR